MDGKHLTSMYDKFSRKLDVRAILDFYGAQNVSEVTAADGTTEIVHSCLLDRVEPHHANGDAHPSAWANTDKNLYFCATYWGGDILHFIAKMEGRENFSDIMPVVGDFLVRRDDAGFREQLEKMFAEHIYSIDIPSYSERVLDPWRKTHPYMRDVRGITQEAQERLQIGFDERENRIVIPHFWKDRLVGWQKRTIPAGPYWPATFPDWPKYRSTSGFPKSETLYAYDRAMRQSGKRSVVVVESPMSVIKACSLDVPHHVIATFGAKVGKGQAELLRDFDQVIVWFDDDIAGYSGATKLITSLYRHIEVLAVTPDAGADLADLDSADQVVSKIESAEPAALWLASSSAKTMRI